MVSQALGVFQGPQFFCQGDADVRIRSDRDCAVMIEPGARFEDSISEIGLGKGQMPATAPERARRTASDCSIRVQ